MSRPIILDYFLWHYTLGLRSFTAVWLNVMWFIFHFFSISLLLRTFFSPWKRMSDHARLSDIGAFFEALLFNFLSRIFGAIIRFCIILIGLLVLVLCGALYVILGFLWLILPLVLLWSFLFGITSLFS